MTRNLLFLVGSSSLIVTLAGTAIRYGLRRHSASRMEWDELLARFLDIDRSRVDAVALDAIEPSGELRTDECARELEEERIWELLGGIDGVERLDSNCRVMLDMAAYLQRSYSGAEQVVEELRLQARQLEWHIDKLRLAEKQGVLEFHIGTYAQNVAIAYYIMEQRMSSFCRSVDLATFRS